MGVLSCMRTRALLCVCVFVCVCAFVPARTYAHTYECMHVPDFVFVLVSKRAEDWWQRVGYRSRNGSDEQTNQYTRNRHTQSKVHGVINGLLRHEVNIYEPPRKTFKAIVL